MIKIIFEDNHLLVVEKPVNILSQGDDTNDKDILHDIYSSFELYIWDPILINYFLTYSVKEILLENPTQEHFDDVDVRIW